MQPGPDAALPIATVLNRLSDQLAVLAAQARRIEQVAGQIARIDRPVGHAAIRDIQGIDQLRQSLEDLVRLSSRLGRLPASGTLGRDDRAAILSALTLGQSRDLLGPDTGPDDPLAVPPACGDAQLF